MKPPGWVVDLALVGIGLALITLGGPLGGANFGDGETAGAGLLALGAGLRGLIRAGGDGVGDGGPPSR